MTTTPPEQFADDGFRYRLDSRIATGGMGEVWRGTDMTLGRQVAVKLLRPEYADDPHFRSRFETEARNAAALHHPNVASVYDVGEGARPYLVMEYVEGQPLSALMASRRAMDPDVVRDLLTQAAAGLGAAHRAGIVHRDVKPANLIVTPDRTVKITDFGIARAADGLALTGTGQVMGTPAYLSPEQARGNPATPASDVYSLGVVGFECLTGMRPFEADGPVATALAHIQKPVPAIPDRVPADLARVLTRSMAKDPADRYADGDAMVAALTGAEPEAPTTQVIAAPVPLTQVIPATQVLRTPPPVVPPLAPEPLPEPPTADLSRGTGWPIAVGLFFLLVIAAIVVVVILLVTQGNDSSPPISQQSTPTAPTTGATTPSQTQSTAPATINLDEGDYLGRDVQDVAADLMKLQLKVDPEPVPNPDGKPAGQVTGVSPRKDLHAGDTVTVNYYDEATPTTPTTSAPTTPATTPTTESPSPSPSDSPSSSPSDSPSTTTGAVDTTSDVPSQIVETP